MLTTSTFFTACQPSTSFFGSIRFHSPTPLASLSRTLFATGMTFTKVVNKSLPRPLQTPIWNEVSPLLLDHVDWWCTKRHYGYCGQSCGCCRSHNPEDGENCQPCWQGWILTCINQLARTRVRAYIRNWKRIQPPTPEERDESDQEWSRFTTLRPST